MLFLHYQNEKKKKKLNSRTQKVKGKYLFLNKHLLKLYTTCMNLFLHYKVPHSSLLSPSGAGSEFRS